MAGRFSIQPLGGPDRHDPWFRIGTLDIGSAALAGVLAIIGLIGYSIAPRLFGLFALDSYAVTHGQVWRLATWPIPNPPSIWTAISIAILWYFGMMLERTVGRFRFGFFLVALTVVVGLVGLGVQLLLYGASPLGLGYQLFGVNQLGLLVLLTFIAEHPHVRFFFNIPGWVLGLVYVGIQFLSFVSVGDVVGLFVFIAGLLVAALLAKSIGLLDEVEWLPTLRGPKRRPKPAKPARPPRQSRRRPSSGGSVVAGPWTSPADKDQAEFDALLDKINESGMASLSEREVRRLHALRDKLRGG